MLGWLRKKSPEPAAAPVQDPTPARAEERLLRTQALREDGKLREAESELRAVLAEAPSAAAHFQLGNLLQIQNRLESAETNYRLAISADPAHFAAHNCLGVVLLHLGRKEESLAAHERALALQPDSVDAHNNAAVALQALGRLDKALAHYERALALAPDHPGLQLNLAGALDALGRLDESEERYRKAIELAPDLALAHNNLGALLQRKGRLEEAIGRYRRALELEPRFDQARLGLAYALINLARDADGLEELDRYLAGHPEDVNALMQRGRALEQLERLPEAGDCYRKVLELAPNAPETYMRIGALQRQRGEQEEAIANFRRAIDLAPDFAPVWEHLLLSLNYAHGISPSEIYAAHREFGRRFAPKVTPAGFDNSPDRARRLRVGYVSGDFRTHAVAQFMEPILERHDHDSFEIVCYYTLNYTDAVTERLKRHADLWRDVPALSNEALADRIRADGIDVLVDLSGHTGHNRMLALARKPAPVQATWLGYLNTTGLEAMDWRITDRHAAPEGFEAYHSERLYRLPDCQWCYRAPPEAPDVAAPPCARTGRVTFAAFTNPAKITREMIRLWSELLARLPQANLLVVGQGLASIAEEFRLRFVRHGVSAERIELRGVRSFPEYLAMHNEVDIVLDTFPYSGGTTSCHALWMGVPLVSLAGATCTSRGGASLLNAIGLPHLLAESSERYLEIAQDLAAGQANMKELRASLRERMAASPLMDVPGFTRNLETAYRAMWKSWCEAH